MGNIGAFQTHPAADIFPLLQGEDFDALVEDIREHGLMEPCWRVWLDSSDNGTRDPYVLDGRNRLRACLKLGVQPQWRDYEGDSPTSFVVSLNLKRRHLSKSQAAAAAVDALPAYEEEAKARMLAGTAADPEAKLLQGRRAPQSTTKAGSDFGVSGRYVQDAKRIKETAPELHEAVRAGEMDLSSATKAAKLAPEQRSEVVRRVREGESKDAKAAIRQVQRDTATAAIESEPQPLPDGPFRVIVADPPWAYEKRKDDGSHRTALTYPTMTTEELCRLPVGERAYDDCILWLWTTNAFMRDAFQILDAWGFQEKTILTWAKNRMGTGDWLRGQTEHCVMAVRGRPHVNLTNQTTLLHSDVRQHSRKPDDFYELVEALCPGSKLDVFAREARDGWASWGAEADKFK